MKVNPIKESNSGRQYYEQPIPISKNAITIGKLFLFFIFSLKFIIHNILSNHNL